MTEERFPEVTILDEPNDNGQVAIRAGVPSGIELAVVPQIFNAKITKGVAGMPWYDEEWTYEIVADAIAALSAWDTVRQAEPGGWHRHKPSNRRRTNGNPEKEYIRP